MDNQTKNQAAHADSTIDLLELFFILLHRWWIILLVTVAAGFAVLGFCIHSYSPQYTATAKMYVNNNSINIGATQVSITSGDLTAAQSLVQTYSEILKTYLVLDQVSEDLARQGYPGFSYENLISKISCGALNETEVFYIRVVDSDPQRAIDIANTIVEDLPDQISLVIEGSSARTVDRARTAFLVNPGFEKKVLLGALVGFLVSCAFILFLDYFTNDTLKDSEWLSANYSGIPILGQVPNANRSAGGSYGKYYYYSSTEKKTRRQKSSEKGGAKHET